MCLLTNLLTRPTTTRPRSLGAGLVALAVVGALVLGMTGSGHVVAATKPAPPEPAANERFALTPTGADPSQPGSRTNFSFTLNAGGTAPDRVSLFNYGDHPTSFTLYANDALDTAEGQLDVKRADQKPSDAGAWVKLQQGAVVVPPSSAVVVPLVVVVPRGASPGDHAAGIIASLKGSATTPSGQVIGVDQRIGVPLYVRVTGPLHPALAVADLETHYHRSAAAVGGGTLDVTYKIRNSGNVRLSGHQVIQVEAPFGFVLKKRKEPDVPELLPGASVSFHATFTHVLPTIRLSTVVRVTPFSKQGAIHPAPHAVSATSSVWALPWTALLLVAALIGLVVWRQRRRRGRTPPPPPPTREPALTGASSGR